MPTAIRRGEELIRRYSAAAQIAAMEAKLNSMAQRKPADEDYVPGQGAYSTPPIYSGSASPSPMPEGDLEDEIGDEEGMKAADELQKEMEAEIKKEMEDPSEANELSQPPPETSKPLSSATLPTNPTLPPRPVAGSTAPAEKQPSKKEEIFKRGLAGLPKKPVF
jgi:hypothetical protein